MTTRHLTRYKWSIQFHAKPIAKLTIVRQRTPEPRERRFEFYALLDAILHLCNLLIASYAQDNWTRNLMAAHCAYPI